MVAGSRNQPRGIGGCAGGLSGKSDCSVCRHGGLAIGVFGGFDLSQVKAGRVKNGQPAFVAVCEGERGACGPSGGAAENKGGGGIAAQIDG